MAVADKERSEEEEFVVEETSIRPKKVGMGSKKDEVPRYEVRLGPPMASARKVRPQRTEAPIRDVSSVQGGGGAGTAGGGSGKGGGAQYANSQHIYKLEDDLRRTRDIVEDLRHTTSLLEGDMRDLKAEMERISYLLRSLEGLKNAMKDIESTVSELSGLYDMISANVNPFIDIPKMDAKVPNGAKRAEPRRTTPPQEKGGFVELDEIFDDANEGRSRASTDDMDYDVKELSSGEALLKWTGFLLGRVGREGLEKALDYYKDLGWVDEETIAKVMSIARGTAVQPQQFEGKRTTWKMDAEDHMRSLEHIKRIKGIA